MEAQENKQQNVFEQCVLLMPLSDEAKEKHILEHRLQIGSLPQDEESASENRFPWWLPQNFFH